MIWEQVKESGLLLAHGEYMADMISTLDSLENAGVYWRMGRLEQLGFSLAMKLGLV